MPTSRTTTLGFAQLTKKNLVSVKEGFESKKDIYWRDVHVVTQLVNSLLGIVVIPRRCRQIGRHSGESRDPDKFGIEYHTVGADSGFPPPRE